MYQVLSLAFDVKDLKVNKSESLTLKSSQLADDNIIFTKMSSWEKYEWSLP